MENQTAKPAVFRNDLFLVAFYLIVGVLAMLFAWGMFILTITLIFPLHGYSMGRGVSVFESSIGTVLTFLFGFSFWVQGVRLAHYKARLDDRGVDFHMGSKTFPHETFFAWDQIAAVKHWRVAGSNCYAVVGKDKRVFEFTAYVFWRPKKLASRIAAHIGLPIEEIK
jgi:hypothetical protein